MVKCRSCNLTKELELFPVNKSYKSGRATICKKCSAEVTRKYRVDNAAKYKANKFNTTEEEVAKRLLVNTCEICGGPPKSGNKYLAIDHCHKTGKLRGMLCDLCNTALGKFKDSEELLTNAIKYIRKYNAVGSRH